VPDGLPALTRATRISEGAAALGFDWTCLADIRAKVAEELGELDVALEEAGQQCSAAVFEEFGDLLVALVNLSRHLRMDPENALRAASAKFERRFRHMENLAASRGRALQSLSAAEWDELWREVKRLAPSA
jgi:ATP diphosphatase